MSDTSDSYETYETTTPAFDTTSYDTTSYDAPYDAGAIVDSYSYDSTNWSEVGAESSSWTSLYYEQAGISNDLWNAAVDAYVAGDDVAAYDLTQASYAVSAVADQSWDTSYDVWYNSAETTTVTTYDTSWSATEPVDTAWSAAAPVDTSWSAASVDTSWSADSTDTSWSATSE